jgi:hypothetical protein
MIYNPCNLNHISDKRLLSLSAARARNNIKLMLISQMLFDWKSLPDLVVTAVCYIPDNSIAACCKPHLSTRIHGIDDQAEGGTTRYSWSVYTDDYSDGLVGTYGFLETMTMPSDVFITAAMTNSSLSSTRTHLRCSAFRATLFSPLTKYCHTPLLERDSS